MLDQLVEHTGECVCLPKLDEQRSDSAPVGALDQLEQHSTNSGPPMLIAISRLQGHVSQTIVDIDDTVLPESGVHATCLLVWKHRWRTELLSAHPVLYSCEQAVHAFLGSADSKRTECLCSQRSRRYGGLW